MEPKDLPFDEAASGVDRTSGQGISSFHSGKAHAAFADGSVRAIADGIAPVDLRAMLTADGGEDVDFGKLGMPELNQPEPIGGWTKAAAIGLLVVSAVLLLARKRRKRARGGDRKTEGANAGPPN